MPRASTKKPRPKPSTKPAAPVADTFGEVLTLAEAAGFVALQLWQGALLWA